MIKVSFKLTPEQQKLIEPLTEAMHKARGAVFGQCFVAPLDWKYGNVDLYYLTPEQHAIVTKR